MDVVINPTPSQELVAQAVKEVKVSDKRGRQLVLKKPGVLAQFRLVEVLGESAKNEVYMGMVLPLLFLASIDGEPVFQPARKSELEALIQQLDDDGIEAVMEGVRDAFGNANAQADQERLKN